MKDTRNYGKRHPRFRFQDGGVVDAKLLRKDLALTPGLGIEPAKPLPRRCAVRPLRHHWLLLLSGGVTKPGRSGATASRYSTIGP